MTDTQAKPYTAEDLNKHFATGHWCPKCGFEWETSKARTCFHSLKPPLHERWPECRPEVRYQENLHLWIIRGRPIGVSFSIAADLCVMGVVKAVRKVKGTVTFGGSRDGEIVIISLTGREAAEGISPHLPKAVAIAGHRLRDAVEAKG